MSGIRGLGGVPAPVAAARAARGGGGFRLAGGQATRTDGALAAGSVAAPALSLLALQESGAAAERDARARARGLALLDALAGLQAGLLRGAVDAGLPARLAALGEGEAAADPALAALVAQVTLRARIELARLATATDMAPG